MATRRASTHQNPCKSAIEVFERDGGKNEYSAHLLDKYNEIAGTHFTLTQIRAVYEGRIDDVVPSCSSGYS